MVGIRSSFCERDTKLDLEFKTFQALLNKSKVNHNHRIRIMSLFQITKRLLNFHRTQEATQEQGSVYTIVDKKVKQELYSEFLSQILRESLPEQIKTQLQVRSECYLKVRSQLRAACKQGDRKMIGVNAEKYKAKLADFQEYAEKQADPIIINWVKNSASIYAKYFLEHWCQFKNSQTTTEDNG